MLERKMSLILGSLTTLSVAVIGCEPRRDPITKKPITQYPHTIRTESYYQRHLEPRTFSNDGYYYTIALADPQIDHRWVRATGHGIGKIQPHDRALILVQKYCGLASNPTALSSRWGEYGYLVQTDKDNCPSLIPDSPEDLS